MLGLAAVASLALVGAACSSDDEAEDVAAEEGGTEELTEMSVQLSWLPDTEFAPMFIADDAGYFAEEGVEVEFISGGPDIGAVEAIVGSGGADIGVATDIFSVVSANADGSPFVVLGSLYQTNLSGFISPQDAPIDSAEDLVGKTIGGSQGVQPKYEAILSLNGLDPTDYTFVPSGYGPDLVINGDVDAQSVFVTDEVIAYRETTGEEPVLLTFDDAGLPSYSLTLFTTQDYLDNNRDAVKGFLKAIQLGFADNKADPELGPNLVADVYGVDAGLELEPELKKNVEYLKYAESEDTEEYGYLWVSSQKLTDDVYAGMEAADLATVPADEVLDMSLLEEIQAEQ